MPRVKSSDIPINKKARSSANNPQRKSEYCTCENPQPTTKLVKDGYKFEVPLSCAKCLLEIQ